MSGEHRPSGVLDLDALADQIATELRRWRVPGVELAAVRDGRVVVAQGYGLRDHARGLPATAATLFHHGSITKAFTAALVGTLVEEGLLEWDRPVRDYWPPFRLYDPVATERVSMADLLSHRSGLARHEWVWLANPSWSGAELARRLRHLPLAHDLRAEFEYCNLGYALVRAGRRGGDPHRLAHRAARAGPRAAGHARHADPARAGGEPGRPCAPARPPSRRDRPGAVPSRRRHRPGRSARSSCATDMARWLLFHLGDGALDGRRVLSAETLPQVLHRIRFPLDAPRPDPTTSFATSATRSVGAAGSGAGGASSCTAAGSTVSASEALVLPDEGVGVVVERERRPRLRGAGRRRPRPPRRTAAARGGAATVGRPPVRAVGTGARRGRRLGSRHRGRDDALAPGRRLRRRVRTPGLRHAERRGRRGRAARAPR